MNILQSRIDYDDWAYIPKWFFPKQDIHLMDGSIKGIIQRIDEQNLSFWDWMWEFFDSCVAEKMLQAVEWRRDPLLGRLEHQPLFLEETSRSSVLF